MQYAPDGIKGPWDGTPFPFPYEGLLGNRKWELVASYFVSASKRKKYWVILPGFTSDYDTRGMIEAGFLEPVYEGKKSEWSGPESPSVKLKKIGVRLTEKTIERLAEYTEIIRNSNCIAKYCDIIIDEFCPASESQPDAVLEPQPNQVLADDQVEIAVKTISEFFSGLETNPVTDDTQKKTQDINEFYSGSRQESPMPDKI